MTRSKIIPIGRPQAARKRLVKAVGKVLARKGFKSTEAGDVAEEAGVNKAFIDHHFGGLDQLIAAYGRTVDFWPSVQELLKEIDDPLEKSNPAKHMSTFFKGFAQAMRKRPRTKDILAWEMLERSESARQLEYIRERTALEFFERMTGDPPEDVDLPALVMVLAAAVYYLTIRSRTHKTIGGVDLQSDEGWERIEKCIDHILTSILAG